ncbi:hypothetical protein [Brevundimonas diminuta]|uniref:Uncharacterized protein n=1 Tax=Brevundimonas diminuta TaxID=293 RepID=A0A410NVE5_BREDI|nr:hypothetical protein [Brevundimonas diminuta]QAT13848.1 hypothetical protein EQG53_05455 [Brevundimonas diminuta]QQB88787.1 hypothetical protein I6H83_16975 [Brevundimonas diminuta]GEC02253.1 hypothetical protein BDI01nite_33170 [Brevundimonas diminuta]
MAEVKHTPGPWNTFQTNGKGVETPGGVTHWVKAGEGYGHVGDGFLSVCIGGSRDAEANARLIAATPDLFDFAQALDSSWSESFPDGPDGECRHGLGALADEHRALWKQCRSALSKATAQQEGS